VHGADDDLSVLKLVHAFFARRLGPQDAEDMVQEVALRLHQRQSGGRIESPEGYAVQVARSVLTDRWRRDNTRQRDNHVSLEDYHHPVEEISPARVMEGKENLALVMRSLDELSARTRQVFVLHRFEEMSYAAIASHMEISVSAVEKHIMKAIRHLSAIMGDQS
jgi:RNA polymerase sigma-70 factor (ECF subfamily)